MSGLVLVDSSVWVDFLRGDAGAKKRLDPVLEARGAATCGAIFAEVVSGARDRRTYEQLALLLRSIDWIDAPGDVWARLAEARFALARQGWQAGVVDLWIALTALHGGCALMTRDRDFAPIARALPLDLELF